MGQLRLFVTYRVSRLVVGVIVLLCTFTGIRGQESFRPFQFRSLGNASPGMYLTDPPSQDSGAFLDHGGHWRWRFSAPQLMNFQAQSDGSFTGFTSGRVFTRWNSNLEVAGVLEADGFDTDFHDVKVIPGGKYLVLAVEYRQTDMSALISGGQKAAFVMGLVVQERTFAGQTTWTWKSLDHIPVTDATTDVDLRQNVIDYIHANSLWLDNDGNVLISCRHLDEVIKVNRATGELMWRWGGSGSKGNEFTWLNDTRDGFTGFSHQHTVQRLPDGSILMFDNGNLRPGSASRAVRYRINEETKTAERVWEYNRNASVVTHSMGSAEELPNGNVLIGWGNNPEGIILTEVTPDGDVVAEALAEPGYPSTSYRVSKAQVKMVGAQRDVSAPGTYSFERSNVSVGATLTLNAPASANITVEQHRNASVLTAIPAQAPCRYLPIRWTVRAKSTGVISGTLTFSLANADWLTDVTAIVLYNRAVEGTGQWAKVQGAFNEITKTFTTTAFATGEYMVASTVCLTPTLREPLTGQTQVALVANLEWTAAQNDRGYEVVVATAPSFQAGTIVYRDTVSALVAQTSKLASLTTYHWRVRALRIGGPGQWSETGWFRTRIDMPSLVRPLVKAGDTVAFLPAAGFAWTPVMFAQGYQIRVYSRSDTSTPIIDHHVNAATSVVLDLLPNTWYYWQVRSTHDSTTSLWTPLELFVTTPGVPMLLAPRDSAVAQSREGLPVAWRSVDAAKSYAIRVVIKATANIVIDRIVPDTVVVMPLLLFDTTYAWSIRAIGAYGPGAWSREHTFRTIGPNVFPPAVLVSPLPLDVIAKNEVEFVWHHTRATSFVVNVYETEDDNVPIWTTSTSDQRAKIPAGFLLNNVDYYWSVTSTDESGDAFESERWSFSVSVPPAIIVGLHARSPRSGSVDVPIEGTLIWAYDSRVSSYRVQMFDQSGATVLSISVTDTTLDYTGLRRGSDYTWRVIGFRGNDPIDTGAVASFTTARLVSSVLAEGTSKPSLEWSGQALRFTIGDGVQGHVNMYDLGGTVVARCVLGEWVSLASLPYGVYSLIWGNNPATQQVFIWRGSSDLLLQGVRTPTWPH
jgi:hypothetical protein